MTDNKDGKEEEPKEPPPPPAEWHGIKSEVPKDDKKSAQ